LTTTSRRLARNTVFSAVGEGSNVLLFLLFFIAARALGPEAFGVFSAAFAYVGLFRIFPDFGMSYASTLDISRDRSLAARLVGNLLGFQAILSVATLVLCLGTGWLLFSGSTWICVLVLSVDLIFKSIKTTLRWLLKAVEAFGAEALSLLAERLALLVFGTAAMLLGHGVVGFVLAFLLVRFLDTTGLLLWVHVRLERLSLRREPAVWGQLLRKGLPFAYAGLMITLFFQVDAVLLEKMRNAREVGWYSSPVRVLEGLTLVPRILGYALIPTMAAAWASAPGTVSELYRRGSKYMLIAGLPVVAFGVLASDLLILVLFGPAYQASVAAAVFLLPSALFMFLSNFGETTLACINRWRTIVVTSTIALAINIALNLWLIPDYGYVGAAMATLATEASYFLMIAIALHGLGHRADWVSMLVRPLAATLLFALVLRASHDLGLIAASAIAGLTYLAATFVLRVWDPHELALMREFAGRRDRPLAGL
jgi:O-antigen/teichoic acid export membrane protein